MIEWCNSNQGFVMAVLTAVYVIATIHLVRGANRANSIAEQNVRDLTKLEQERLRPLVEIRIESDVPFLVLRVTNQGQTPAYEIRVETSPLIKAVMGGDGSYPSAKTEKSIGIIEHGMGSLGAGCSESAILGTLSRVEEVYPEMRFVGKVRFRSFTGQEYSSPVDIDLRYMKGALHVNHKTIHDVANRLEEIRRELGHLRSGFHKPHVIVQSIAEKRAEDEAFVSQAHDQLPTFASQNENAQQAGAANPCPSGTSVTKAACAPSAPEASRDT
jgi:hypothetical protein